MKTNSSAILVPPRALPPATNDIRGIKPPVEIPNGWAWLWWTLAVVLLLSLAAAAWARWRKQRAAVPATPPVPAHVRARNKLREALSLISDPRLFCILVSDTLRVYLEERFDFHAPERTTEEFLQELQATRLLIAEQKQSLAEFLQSCDLVKFARYEPTETELRALYESALRLIDETQHESLGLPPVDPPPAEPARAAVESSS